MTRLRAAFNLLAYPILTQLAGLIGGRVIARVRRNPDYEPEIVG